MPETKESNDIPDGGPPSRYVEAILRHVAQLSEHFESVVIIGQYRKPGTEEVSAIRRSAGSWYANYAALKEAVLKDEKLMADPD